MGFRRAVTKARRSRPQIRLTTARSAARLSAAEKAAIEDWVGALEGLGSYLSFSTISDLVENGEYMAILDLIDWLEWEMGLRSQLNDRFRTAVEVGGARSFSEVVGGPQATSAAALAVRHGAVPKMPDPDDFGIPAPPTSRSGGFYTQFRFDMTNPFAVAQVDAHAADLVRGVGEVTRTAIKQLVGSAFREGFTAQELARRLRQTVGLTTRQALAVQRYKNRLLRGGMDPDVANRMTDRYYQKTLRRRAETIARTEIMRASNFGRQAGWLSAADQGLLSATDSVKEWITAPERSKYGPPCETCLPMDGVKVVGIETPFKTPGGQELVMPPAHPNCRCTAVVWPPDVPDDFDPSLGADLVGTTD